MSEIERRGKKKLIYRGGKLTDCDYNKFNINFLRACWMRYVSLLENYSRVPKLLWTGVVTSVGILILVFITFIPVVVPILVYLDRKRIKENYTDKELYKWKEE